MLGRYLLLKLQEMRMCDKKNLVQPPNPSPYGYCSHCGNSLWIEDHECGQCGKCHKDLPMGSDEAGLAGRGVDDWNSLLTWVDEQVCQQEVGA